MQLMKQENQFIRLILCGILIGLAFFSANIWAKDQPLPDDQAFALTVTVAEPNKVVAKWKIAPGYYLYRDRISFSYTPKINAEVVYPQGTFKNSEEFGRQEVYSGHLSIPILFQQSEKNIQLTVKYQGCSEKGFCYPPMQKQMTLDLSGVSSSSTQAVAASHSKESSFYTLLTDQNRVQAFLDSAHFGVLLLVFLTLGLLLAFTPCVLPMIPILTSIILGQKQSMTTQKAFFLSSSYVLGSAITYAVVGIIAASMGSSLQVWLQKGWVIAIVSSLFVLLAFSLFGLYELRLPRAWQRGIAALSNKQQRGTYIGAFTMGMISTLIVSPCVTAPLVGILIYIGHTGNVVFGAGALFAMGIGMGIPLILIGTSAGKWVPKSGPWMEAIKKTFGFLMLGMAIWLLSRVVSFGTTVALTSILLFFVAFFFGAYVPLLTGRHLLNRFIGGFFAVFGVLLLIGGFGMSNGLHKWVSPDQIATKTPFTVVRDLDELNQRLFAAQLKHKPVVLDFYADWCESCIAMDKKVFSKPDVQHLLHDYVLLRADLTANNAADEAMLKHYNVIAPPTILFFNAKGQEVDTDRIVGEVNAKEFIARINASSFAENCQQKVNC